MSTKSTLAVVLCLFLASVSHAVTVDWSNTAATTAWATGGNWVGGSAPANDLTLDIARFNKASYAQQPNAGTTSVLGIEVGDGTTAAAALTLSGTQLSIGASGVTVFANAGAAAISSPVTLGATQAWTNSSSNMLTANNALGLDANALTVAGSGNTTLSGVISGAGGSIVKSGAGTLTLSNVSSTFTGGITVNGGTVVLSGGTTYTGGGPPPTAGILGTGPLTLAGGTLQNTISQSNTYTNALTVSSASTIQLNQGASGKMITFAGPTSLGADLKVERTVSGDDKYHLVFAGQTSLDSDIVFTGSRGASPQLKFAPTSGNTLAWSANRVLTFNDSGAVTLNGMLAGGANTLTIKGTNPEVFLGGSKDGAGTSLTGAAGGVIVDGPTVTFGNGNTFTGGVTLASGTIAIGNNGGLGPDTFVINGGTVRSASTSSYKLSNAVTINNSVTLGSVVNTGLLTFEGNIGQTVTAPVTLTAMSAVTFGGDFRLFTWGSNAVTYRGPGLVTQNTVIAATSNTGSVSVGESVASGSLGGNLSANSQTALGNAAYTLNYGGTLTYTGSTNPTNGFTIRNGGTMVMNTGPNPGIIGGTPGTLVVESMATLSGYGANSARYVLNGNTFPTAGAIFFAARPIELSGAAYPSLTGTMVFGGGAANQSPTLTGPAMALSSSAGSARTIAINYAGNPGAVGFTNGISLNADLTIAGTGNAGLAGLVASGAGGSLGNITQDTARAVTIAMAPTGMVSSGALGNTGGVTVSGGTLVNAATNGTAGNLITSGTFTLDGGGYRVNSSNNSVTTTTQNMVIGANGGAIEVAYTGNAGKWGYGGVLSGTGVATFRAISRSSLVVSGNNSGFSGGMVVESDNTGTGQSIVAFNSVNATGAAGNVITVKPGGTIAFDSQATANAVIGKFSGLDSSSVLGDPNSWASVDLSASGLNKDLWLAFGNNSAYSGTITSSAGAGAGTLRIAHTTHAETTTFNTANQFQTLNTVFSTVPVAYGASGMAVGWSAISASQNYAGTTTVTGTTKNALMGSGTAGTTLTLTNNGTTSQGDLSATSGITVTRGASLNVAGTAANYGRITSANVPITVMGGGTLTDGSTTAADNNGVTDRVANTATLTLGGTDGGGTFRVAFPAATFTHAQTLDSVAVAAGSSTITTVNTAAGTLNLTFGGAGATNYTRSAGGVVNFALPTGNTNSVSFASGATTITGVTSTNVYVGMPIYMVNSSTIAPGTLVSSYDNAGGTMTLSKPTLAAGSAVSPTYLVNNGTIAFTNAPTNATAVIGGILVGATLNTNDFVAASAGGIFPPTYASVTSAASFAGAGSTANVSLDNQAGSATTVTGAATINSLRLNSNSAGFNITGGTTLTLGSGMLLLPSTYTNSQSINTSGGTGSGILASGTNELVIVSNGGSNNGLAIGAQVNASTALTYRAVNSGCNLTLSNASNTIGDVYAYSNTIYVSAAGALGALDTTRTLNLLGGQVVFSHAASTTYGSGVGLVVGPQGTRLNGTGDGLGAKFSGPVTLNGDLRFGDGSKAMGTIELAGTITGAGTIGTDGNGGGTSRPAMIISGSNPNWTGGIVLGGSSAQSGAGHLYLASSASAGTGPITTGTSTSKRGFIYLDTNASSASNYTNNFVFKLPMAMGVWGQGPGLTGSSSNFTTISGDLISSSALVLQGYASGDAAVSELVLAGKVSLTGSSTSGTPGDAERIGYHSYGTSTAAQNFINGQGGITAGATRYTGLIDINAYFNGSIRVQQSGNTYAESGAEGFVRFSGTNSFIPGAVGPGYIAAIRKAGTGKDGLFGYLLTGGTTYTLPEGKGFVIGSLGSGTQQYGTLGAASGSATLLGSSKLAGFATGDVNVHANAMADSQSLNVFAREAFDTLVLGSVATSVVFTPTYGDSGFTTAMTLMADRTGTTTLNKIGAGTVELTNVAYKNTLGADVSSSFSWKAMAGTLKPAAGTLTGTNLTVSSAATLYPVAGATPVDIGTLTLEVGSLLSYDLATVGTSSDINVTGTNGLTLNGGTFSFTNLGSLADGTYPLITYAGTVAGSFSNLSNSTPTIGAFTLTLLNDTDNSRIALKVLSGGGPSIWNGTGSTWNTGGHWVNGTIPDGVDKVATFNATGIATPSLTVASPVTVGQINLESATSYTVGGTSLITVNGTEPATGITVTSGTHEISAPLAFATNATITGAESLKLGAVSIAASAKVTLAASSGNTARALVTKSVTLAGATDAWTSTLDIADNRLVIDYSGGTSPLEDVKNQAISGWTADRNWTGPGLTTSSTITSGLQMIGFAEASDVLGIGPTDTAPWSGGGDVDVNGTSVLVKFTYAGDADLNGSVDLDDLFRLIDGFNGAVDPVTWSCGDFDYNGSVDLDDLFMLIDGFNASSVDGPLSPVAVPEPGMLGLVAAGLLLARRRTK